MALSSKPTLVLLGTLLFLIVPCNSAFANRSTLSSAPRSEQNGGLDGVYVHTVSENCGQYPRSHKLLQFYDDGLVLSASVCSHGDMLEEWSSVQRWFHRNTDDLEITRGEYRVSQDEIHFSITLYDNHTGEVISIDYTGTYSAHKLVLDVYDRYHGRQEQDQEYLRLVVTD